MSIADDRMLTRVELAAALTAEGYPIKAGTLAQMAHRDDGPPFEFWGSRCIYLWGPSLIWARGRVRPRVAAVG
jgi:hypothetical protein